MRRRGTESAGEYGNPLLWLLPCVTAVDVQQRVGGLPHHRLNTDTDVSNDLQAVVGLKEAAHCLKITEGLLLFGFVGATHQETACLSKIKPVKLEKSAQQIKKNSCVVECARQSPQLRFGCLVKRTERFMGGKRARTCVASRFVITETLAFPRPFARPDMRSYTMTEPCKLHVEVSSPWQTAFGDALG